MRQGPRGRSSIRFGLCSYPVSNHRDSAEEEDNLQKYPQAMNPAEAWPNPHHVAMAVTSHCFFEGKNSRNTVGSSTKLPPAPKPSRAMKVPKKAQ